MKKKEITFNIHDLNFILTFAGFAIFTSLTDAVSSIAYRAVALFIAFLCFQNTGYKIGKLPTAVKVLLILMILLDVKTAFHLMTETGYSLQQSRNLALLFIFGVTLIPVLAFVSGYRKIHWKSTLVILEFFLFFTIIRGYVSSLDMMDVGRMSLNARQSTLAFGDNSGYLLILSVCLLKYSKMITAKTKRQLWQSFLSLAIVFSILGLARAGSRGPFVAALMGLLFVFITMRLHRQFNTFLLAALFVGAFGITTQTLERFAPVLFSRMEATIDEGDTSGRDVLFAHAIDKIVESPIAGGNPVIVLNDGFTTYHNGYLDVGVGLGILGFMVYVCLSLWILIRLIKKRHNFYSPELIFASGMYFLSATRAMTGASLVSNPNYALSIVLACIVATMMGEHSNRCNSSNIITIK